MIVSLSERLLGAPRSKPALPLKYRKELESIHATGKHLDRLVSDVLDLGRSQLGQLKLDLRSTDLGELLNEIQLVVNKWPKRKGWHGKHISLITPVRKS